MQTAYEEKTAIETLIYNLKPDANIVTETEIGKGHDTSEFLSKQLGYKVSRNDNNLIVEVH